MATDTQNQQSPIQNNHAQQASEQPPEKKAINLLDLRSMDINELHKKSREMGLDNTRQTRQELLFSIQKALVRQGHKLILDGESSGVLEIVQDGYGFLRSPQTSYNPGADDLYVSPQIIKQKGLKTGVIFSKATIRPPNRGERYFAIEQVIEVNMKPVAEQAKLVPFGDLPAEFPTDWMQLETGSGKKEDITGRIVDMVAPIGKGQRCLIAAQPKTGKSMMMQNIAQAIIKNNPESKIFFLLVDERPEEVTDNQRVVDAEIIASPFDNPPARHIQVAEMVLAKAKRLAESGHDVVIFLDSITRLARAYNHVAAADNKILSGGVSASALQRPKRFFGAARNIRGGGSLTIIATALIDTGSKADEVIYEEFKGTGNHEIHLLRSLAEGRHFPAIDVKKSGTRKEELLVSAEYLKNCWILRRYLQSQDDVHATQFLIQRMSAVLTNLEFFKAMKER